MKVLPSVRRAAAACAGLIVIVLVAACAAPPPQATSVGEMPFEQAVAQATDGLVGQLQKGPAFLAKLAKRSVVLDPMLDAATGQQTAATTLLETRVGTGTGFRPNIVGSGAIFSTAEYQSNSDFQKTAAVMKLERHLGVGVAGAAGLA